MNFIYTILPTITLCVGFFVGYKLNTKKESKTFILKNPIKTIQRKIEDHIQTKEEKEELEKINTILENIDNYDGTGANQKEVDYVEDSIL